MADLNLSKWGHYTYRSGILFCSVGLVLLLTVAASFLVPLVRGEDVSSSVTSLALRGSAGAVTLLIGFALMASGTMGAIGTEIADDPADIEDELEARRINGESDHVPRLIVRSDQMGFCCIRCRAVNDVDAKFCDQCGNRLVVGSANTRLVV